MDVELWYSAGQEINKRNHELGHQGKSNCLLNRCHLSQGSDTGVSGPTGQIEFDFVLVVSWFFVFLFFFLTFHR